jgi:LysR family transcriptional regulator, hydrogen peroxide-inducible genes activator
MDRFRHRSRGVTVEIEQLRHFVRVAEVETITGAATLIGLSQSALSRSIARLEEELGRPLFERQTRRVTLTDTGRLLLDRAQTILAMVDDLKAEIGDDGQSGKLRIAAIPTIAPYYLPERLRSFHRLYPRARSMVVEDTTERLLKMIADGEVDLAIAALPISAKYVQVEPLFEEELLLATSREHPLAKKKTVSVADIAGLPFVLLGEAHCLSENVLSFCIQKSFQPVSVERTSQLSMVQELVALGHGVSLVPTMARVRDSGGTRVYRSLTGATPTRTIVMISNPYRFRSELMCRFQEHLRASLPS